MKRHLLSTFIAITIVAYCAGHAAGGDGSGPIRTAFIIAVGMPHGAGFRWTVTGRFSGATWDRLWIDLRVPEKRWAQWQESGGRLLIIPEMPAISELAHIDEGAMSFDPALLGQDCDRAVKVAENSDVETMLEDLRIAIVAAAQSGGEVYIYPSTGEAIGDQFSS